MRFHHTWLPVCLVSVIPFCGFTAGFETDDFDDGVRDATKWVLPDVVSRNGSFAETNSHLEFVATQPLPSYETATAAWRYGLSPFADWSVSVDVTLPPVPQSTNLIFASWELVSDAQNPDNGRRFIYFRSDPDAQQTRFAYDRVVVGSTNAGSSQASLRLRYLAVERQFYVDYKPPDSAKFNLFDTFSAAGLRLESSALFHTGLRATSSFPLQSGMMFADNFAVTPMPFGDAIPPEIISGPVNESAVAGSLARFRVSALGSPLSYQWLFNDDAIPGATNSMLELSNVSTTQVGSYSVLLSNTFGAAMSSAVALTVTSPLNIGVYYSRNLIDYEFYVAGAEGINATLTQLGYRVQFVTNWFEGLTNDVMIFSYLAEQPPLGFDKALVAFVARGGTLITREIWLVNQAFGTSLKYAFVGEQFVRTEQDIGTPFANGPSSLPATFDIFRLDSSSLPLGSRDIYRSDPDDSSVVTLIPFGLGDIVFFGCNWYLANPTSMTEGPWVKTLVNAVLTRFPMPLVSPGFSLQPQSQSRLEREDVTLNVRVFGSGPVTVQWYGNGQPISGATNATLAFPWVSTNQTGDYFVVATNPAGKATSAVARVEIRPTRGVIGYTYPGGIEAAAKAAGFTPIFIDDVAHLDLSRLDLLMINLVTPYDSPNVSRSREEIQNWVINGGKLILHDGSSLFFDQLRLVPMCGTNVSVLEPADNLLVSGPHGMLDNHSLADADWFYRSVFRADTLPERAIPLLGAGCGTNVVAYSYGLGKGCIYACALPLEAFIGSASRSLAQNVETIYIPNLLEYVDSFSGAGAPLLVVQPVDGGAIVGTSTALTVGVDGQPPLSYQWFRNGSPISGAASATLQLEAFSAGDEGAYTVLVSNSLGTIVTPPVVLKPVTLFPLRLLSLLGEFPQVTNGVGGGAIALSPTSVFETSPYGTVRYDAPTLRPATNAPKYNLLVSNLRTDTLYALDDDSAPLDIVTGRLSRLIELDPNGFPTTNLIKLSREIPLGAKTGFFAGADSIVVVSDYTVRRIDVRSGWVIDLGSVQLPSVVSCENGFYCGLAESFSNSVFLVYVQDSDTVVRTQVPSGVTTTVARFVNLGTMCGITASPKRGRWYFHYHGVAQFSSEPERIGTAAAFFDPPPRILTMLTNRSINEDGITDPISFTMQEIDTPYSQVLVSVGTSNPNLLPASNITLSGTSSTRKLVLKPAADEFGTSVVTITVTDAIGQSTNRSFTLTVNPVNDPPSFVKGEDITVLEDCGRQSLPHWATAISPGPANEAGQSVEFDVTNDLPALFLAAPAISSDGTLSFTPAPNANGLANVSVVLRDDGGTLNGASNSSVAQTFVIFVQPVNDAPVAISQSVSLPEDRSISITLAATDEENDPLIFRIVAPPTNGVLTGNGASYLYRPRTNFFGHDSFTFKVSDGELDSMEAAVAIDVTPVNDPPVPVITVTPWIYLLPDSTTAVVIAPNKRAAVVLFGGKRSYDIEMDPLSFAWFEGDSAVPFASTAVATNRLEPSLYRITLVVNDGSDDGSSTVTVPVIRVDEAIALVIDFLQKSTLPSNQIEQFVEVLEEAIGLFQQGENVEAIRVLVQFQERVAKKLFETNPVLAKELTRAAQLIIDSQLQSPRLVGYQQFSMSKFKFSFLGEPGYPYIIESSTNLLEWVPFIHFTSSTGTEEFTTDLQSMPMFFRAIFDDGL